MIQKCERLILLLSQEGIEVLLLDAAGVILNNDASLKSRALGRLDILLHTEQRAEALRILTAAGHTFIEQKADNRGQAEGGKGSLISQEATLAIHWRPFILFDKEQNKQVWSRSVPGKMGSAQISLPSTEDQFLLCALSGLLASAPSSIRVPYKRKHPSLWIADCVTLHRTAQLNWKLIMEIAKGIAAQNYICQLLTYLREELNCDVPDDISDRVKNHDERGSQQSRIGDYVNLCISSQGKSFQGRLRRAVYQDILISHGPEVLNAFSSYRMMAYGSQFIIAKALKRMKGAKVVQAR